MNLNGERYIKHFVSINITRVLIDGMQMDIEAPTPYGLLQELYKQHVGDYPKFHKMDPLSKLGFVTSELLLDAEGKRDYVWGEHRGVVLFGSYGSLADDRSFQQTIVGDSPFPSPSLFVYTLPNVITGEIAIRNHYYGESNCLVLPSCNPERMAEIITTCFLDTALQSLLSGWVDCMDENHFNATMFVVSRYQDEGESKTDLQQLKDELATIFVKTK